MLSSGQSCLSSPAGACATTGCPRRTAAPRSQHALLLDLVFAAPRHTQGQQRDASQAPTRDVPHQLQLGVKGDQLVGSTAHLHKDGGATCCKVNQSINYTGSQQRSHGTGATCDALRCRAGAAGPVQQQRRCSRAKATPHNTAPRVCLHCPTILPAHQQHWRGRATQSLPDGEVIGLQGSMDACSAQAEAGRRAGTRTGVTFRQGRRVVAGLARKTCAADGAFTTACQGGPAT